MIFTVTRFCFLNIFSTLLCIVEGKYVLITNTKTEYLNDSLFDAVVITPNTGLNTLLEFMANTSLMLHEQRYISVLSDFSNKILNTFIDVEQKEADFYHFDVNSLKMVYSDFREHDVYFQQSFYAKIIQHTKKKENTEICILSYNCNNGVILRIFQNRDASKRTNGQCYQYHPWFNADKHQQELMLINTLNTIRLAPCKYVLFLLNLYDLETVFMNLNKSVIREEKIFFTALSSHFSSRQLIHDYQNFPIINLNNNISDEPTNLKSNTLNDLFKQHIGATKMQNIMTSIADQLRHNASNLNETMSKPEIFDQRCLPSYLQSITSIPSMSKKNHIIATTLLYSFFNDKLSFEPDDMLHCIEGHLCKIPENKGNSTTWKCACCDGISTSLFDKLSKQLNFTYELYIAEDGKYGSVRNGTWNGLINELIQSKADIAVSDLYVNEERSKYVKYTAPYTYSYLSFALRSSKEPLKFVNWEFLKTMHFSLGIAIVVSTIISVIFITLFENKGFLCSGKSHFPSREVMTYIFGLTFQRDMGGLNPRNWSGRIVALGYGIAMMIVMTTYTAHITASGINKNVNDGFQGLKDPRVLNPTPSFITSLMSGSAFEMFFRLNPQLKDVWSAMEHHVVNTAVEGIEKLNNGEIDAFLADDNILESLVSDVKYCSKLKVYHEYNSVNEVAFSYRENFELGEDISNAIYKLAGSTAMKVLMEKWRYTPICKAFNRDESQFDFNYFGGIIFIFCIVLGCCIPIVLLENIWTYFRTACFPNAAIKSNQKSSDTRIPII